MKRYFKSETRAHDIIALWRGGERSLSKIARRVGCTASNVQKCLKRHVPEYAVSRKRAVLRIYDLSQDHVRWLSNEAQAQGVPIELMVSAMLVDAIEEAKAND